MAGHINEYQPRDVRPYTTETGTHMDAAISARSAMNFRFVVISQPGIR